MKNIISTLILAVCMMLSTSCICVTNGVATDDDYDTTSLVSRTYDLANFNKIDCSGVAHIIYKQSDTYSVVARGKEAMLEATTIKVDGQKLVISQHGHIIRNASLYVEISAPEINDIDLSGVASFKTGNIVTNGKFDIDISGVGKAMFDTVRCASSEIDMSGTGKLYGNIIATEEVDIDASGAVKTEFSARAKELKLECSGTVKATADFVGDNVILDCGGTCKIDLTTHCNYLKASNGGVSKISIKGSAKRTDLKSSGVSKIDVDGLTSE